MDKNQLWGLLLMGAVIFGFMYLNKPSAEQLEKQRQEAAEMAQRQNAPSVSDNILTFDSISATEAATIAATIRELGRHSDNGDITLQMHNASMTLLADGKIDGLINAGTDTQLSLAKMVANDWNGISAPEANEALRNLRKALADAARYKGFARCLTGDSTTVRLANDVLQLEISNKGGQIALAQLANYKRYDSLPVTLMSPQTGSYGFELTSATQRFDTRKFYFTPTEQTDTTVTMALELGDGVQWAIRYTLLPGSYLVKMDVLQQGMKTVIPTSVATMDFKWDFTMERNEAGRVFEERNSALYYMYPDGDVDNLSENSDARKEINQRLKWIGFKNQFFSAVLMSENNFAAADLDSKVLKDNPVYLKHMSTNATLDYQAASEHPASFVLYLGPNSYPVMKNVEKEIFPDDNMKLTKLIPLGWSMFRWINTLIVIPVFTFLSKWITSYGLIILLLTIFIKTILFPFTYKSYMSQAKMRLLAPEVKEINDKYPGDENAMRRQQETMALYSKAGANPMSGCLPMLLQMPILIAMFSFFPSAIELRGQSFLWAKDLAAPDAIISWTTNIPFISSTFGNHISLFCLLMTVTNILYNRINMMNQPSQSSMPGMKWMMYLMPVMFLFIFNNYASGLSYYYFLSLLITIGQTYFIRRFVDEDKMRAAMRENAKKPRKKSGFMARLEEAQRQQMAQMREEQKRRSRK